tara:strand:- start:1099 stop:1884 length:786 start_codon:yes stop_codon:yes gene_type:complete
MTITFNKLGDHGRLGNQMFQYATLRGIAKKHGYSFAIPDSDFRDAWHDHQLYEAFKLEGLTRGFYSTKQRVQESTFAFDEQLFNDCPDETDIFGYFQSEKYFENAVEEVRKDFTFKDDIYNPCKEMFDQVGPEAISLHVRRGDYVNQPWHPCAGIEYYEKALSMMPDDVPVIIFSDDTDWCNSQEPWKNDRFLISESGDNLVDLCLMTMCTYHIIANSSFSWWGAWLADSKKVICPSQWFGPPLSEQNDTKDLVPDRWVKI